MSTVEHQILCHICGEVLSVEDITLRLPCGHLYHYICFQFLKIEKCRTCAYPIRIPEFPAQFVLDNMNLKWLDHRGVRKYMLHEIMKREKPKICRSIPPPPEMSDDEVELDSGVI